MVDTEGGRGHVQMRLQRAGVSAVDADRLIEAAVSDPLLVLVVVPLGAEPRVGDRINTRALSGPQTLRIEACAKGGALPPSVAYKWAIVGLPVEPSQRDDVKVSAPVVRRTA